MRAMAALLLGVLAPAAGAATGPAADLCDGGGTGSRAERASKIVHFYKAIDRDALLEESQAGCVERKLDEITPAVDAYCAARKELGHDLAKDELTDLDSKLMHLALDCDREDFEQDMKIRESIEPKSCSDLVRSFRSWFEYKLRRGLGDDAEKLRDQCAGAHLDAVAPPVVEMCASKTISLPAADAEIGARLRQICLEASQ